MWHAGAAVIGLTGRLDACLSGLPSLATTSTATLRFQPNPLEQRVDKGRGVTQGLGASDTRHHTSCRALCIGLGGGSLPNFLSHHFPGLVVDAVELDPTVVTAATQCMGLPYSRYDTLTAATVSNSWNCYSSSGHLLKIAPHKSCLSVLWSAYVCMETWHEVSCIMTLCL